ncbi:hypothetical protein N7486_009727 [Penicillium sp. IBT 16267x]|nr:hypothetical protein N7486_009727 [Penicillium sp. IBT 16267x]
MLCEMSQWSINIPVDSGMLYRSERPKEFMRIVGLVIDLGGTNAKMTPLNRYTESRQQRIV